AAAATPAPRPVTAAAPASAAPAITRAMVLFMGLSLRLRHPVMRVIRLYTGCSASVGRFAIGPTRPPASTPGSSQNGVSSAAAAPAPRRPNAATADAPAARRAMVLFMWSPPSSSRPSRPQRTGDRHHRGTLDPVPRAVADA